MYSHLKPGDWRSRTTATFKLCTKCQRQCWLWDRTGVDLVSNQKTAMTCFRRLARTLAENFMQFVWFFHMLKEEQDFWWEMAVSRRQNEQDFFRKKTTYGLRNILHIMTTCYKCLGCQKLQRLFLGLFGMFPSISLGEVGVSPPANSSMQGMKVGL